MIEGLIKNNIREIPNFPEEGILYKDITPLIEDPEIFKKIINKFYKETSVLEPEIIVAVESRGFIFAAPLAIKLGIPLVLARKQGKLPFKTIFAEYNLEYGKDRLEMHIDSIRSSQRVLIVDDILATGGTAAATIELVNKLEGKVMGLAFLIELAGLKGREKLGSEIIISLLKDD